MDGELTSFLRCVSIYSLGFSADAQLFCSSSNTETIHVFKLDDGARVRKYSLIFPFNECISCTIIIVQGTLLAATVVMQPDNRRRHKLALRLASRNRAGWATSWIRRAI